MKKFFTLGIAATLLLTTVAGMKAQDAQNPWHLVAFENGKEVAFYNTEVITGIEATAQSVTVVLDNGMAFSHPLATATFGFDPRKEGTATVNEGIAAPQWTVHHVNGKLHFSETVNSIAVFTTTGALAARFTGSYSEVPVNLPSGIYIVQAGGKSAKLLVGNGSGNAVAQQEIETKIAVNSPPAPIGLRSDNSIREYWNIMANSTTMSIKISDVEKFSFKSDILVFTLKNGGTVELSNYQGVEFTIEPVEPPTDFHWDLERTFTIGGGAYGYNSELSASLQYKVEYISAVSQTDIIIYEVASGTETKYSRSGISDNLINRDDARISYITRYGGGYDVGDGFSDDRGFIFPAISYIATSLVDGSSNMYFRYIFASISYGVNLSGYDFNGGTNKIPTTFKIDKDGNLVATYVNADGVSRQHTFKK